MITEAETWDCGLSWEDRSHGALRGLGGPGPIASASPFSIAWPAQARQEQAPTIQPPTCLVDHLQLADTQLIGRLSPFCGFLARLYVLAKPVSVTAQ